MLTVASMTIGISDADRLQRVGEAFVQAVAGRDFEGLRAAMADDVRFRLLVPKGPQAQEGAAETVGRFVGWYAEADELRLESSSVDTVAGRLVLSYRFRVRDADGRRVIEQHLVADVAADGRLETIDLLCSGFLPDAEFVSASERDPSVRRGQPRVRRRPGHGVPAADPGDPDRRRARGDRSRPRGEGGPAFRWLG